MRRRLSPPHPLLLKKKLPPLGPPWWGGKGFFYKLKGCGGESLQRLFWLDFCIFEFLIKSIFEESAISHFFAHFALPGPGGHHGDLGPKETSRGNLVFF